MGGTDPYLDHPSSEGIRFGVTCRLCALGQTPEDLRHLALSAPHARTRERALALFEITQHSCATQAALRTGRRTHTVLGWVHAYNAQGL